MYLAVCSTFKDEASYLREWLEFHRLQGVEHFFLYDNMSTDASLQEIEDYLRAGGVTLTECPLPYRSGGQSWVYADAVARARGRVRWLAFIDIDEFLFTPRESSLAKVLADYEEDPGVVVNWQVYGSSGHQTKPPGLVIESYCERAKTQWVRNRRVKSIVDPARVVRARGVHFFDYLHGDLAVTENHEPVQITQERRAVRLLKSRASRLPLVDTDPYAINHSSVKRVSVNLLRINHYAVKSRVEFEAKLDRWQSDAGAWRVQRDYFEYHDRNDVHDPILHPYAPELRRRLARPA
jgi:hypothetical protein